MKGCRPLTSEEIEIVLNSFEGPNALRDRAWVLLGARCGYRISEILSVRVKDAIQGGKVLDRVTVRRKNMKGKHEGRTVLLHPAVKKAIIELLASFNEEERYPDRFLFQSRKGYNRPITRHQAWQILKCQYAKCGLTGNLGTHSLRKHYADRMYELLDRNLFLTQKALNHLSPASTVSYLSFKEEEIDEAILSL